MVQRTVPTPLRILRGNPNKRPLPTGEPQPAKIMPDMPTDLDPIAKKEWKRASPALLKLGLLTEVDGVAFAAYCMAYAAVIRINKAMRACGYKVLAEKHSFLEKKSSEGRSDEMMAVEVKANPLIVQQRHALQTLRFWSLEFGLTPSSRGRMNIPGLKEDDPQESFLDG
jgi:P27 family predicted phage terminase small subunit